VHGGSFPRSSPNRQGHCCGFRARNTEAPSKFGTLARVSIQRLLLTVPADRRAHFAERAAALVQRAEASQVSRTELELALGVLSVLCGAAAHSGPVSSAES
jgi:hypothetical protein